MGIADLTFEHADSLLSYCPDTGLFHWKIARRRRTKVGAIAGGMHVDGYMQVKLKDFGCSPFLHRLAVLLVTREWPKGEVDHINGDRTDNRWCNLRDTSRTENMCNRKVGKNNSSGLMGVHWSNTANRWVARISRDHNKYSLGNFDCLLDAAAARKSAEKLLNFHPNHGRIGK